MRHSVDSGEVSNETKSVYIARRYEMFEEGKGNVGVTGSVREMDKERKPRLAGERRNILIS